MCRLATMIMDNSRKVSVVSYMTMRDFLHENCGVGGFVFVVSNPYQTTSFSDLPELKELHTQNLNFSYRG